jgi:hypothetical protein
MQVQCVCHDTLPWLISFSLDLMSRSAIFLALIAISAPLVCNAEGAEPSATQEREITNAGGEGWQMSWCAPVDRLEHASNWNSGPEPPLSVGQAVTKARDYLRLRGQPNQLALTSAELRHVNGSAPTCFAYVLQFGESLREGLVVVLLDGSVVSPVITQRGPDKSAELSPFDQPVVDFIKRARTVYVFPVKTESATRPNDKDLRLVNAEARQALLGVLCNPANWHHGLMTVGIVYGPGDVGFVFRKDKDELILFFSCEGPAGCTVEGTLERKNILGWLNECAQPQFENWKRSFALPETRK